MDGSTYRPHRDEPSSHEVKNGDNRPFIFVVIFLAIAAGAFFFIDRHQTRNFVHCLTGNVVACRASQ